MDGMKHRTNLDFLYHMLWTRPKPPTPLSGGDLPAVQRARILRAQTDRMKIRIQDAILIQNGVPTSWFFTDSDGKSSFGLGFCCDALL
jgi:hypothetical protein